MTLPSEIIIKQTQCWISNIIVAYNVCPFAKRELERNRIFYQVCSHTTLADALDVLIAECTRLDANPDIETSFVIYSHNFTDFFHFLELVDFSNELLVSQGYEGIYQIASFHPDYCFNETSQDDPSNFTNRSPYPMLHLLRESSMTKALENYQEPDKIPVRNIAKFRELGNTVFQEILDNCKKNSRE
ncbi:MAG: DUF1415 domain-containing protein [Gammaproteobacteria bacterium]